MTKEEIELVTGPGKWPWAEHIEGHWFLLNPSKLPEWHKEFRNEEIKGIYINAMHHHYDENDAHGGHVMNNVRAKDWKCSKCGEEIPKRIRMIIKLRWMPL